MSDLAEMFKKLAKGRRKSAQAEEETKTQAETKPQKETKTKAEASSQEQTPEEKQPEAARAPEPTKKRGRPATGKRSDPDWIGRTYYIRKENDLDVEDELIKLKRAGINLDKSSLVDFLLAAWVKWLKGENIDLSLSEISHRLKDEKA